MSIIGLLFSLVSSRRVGRFTGDPWWLLNEATKWVVAGVVGVGIGLLVTALPGRQRKNLN